MKRRASLAEQAERLARREQRELPRRSALDHPSAAPIALAVTVAIGLAAFAILRIVRAMHY